MNHAKAILACDFFDAVTASFRLLYVFVVIEHASRRLVRVDVTAHPRAEWTLQQLREVVCFDNSHRYLLHDRDSVFARHLDESIAALGLKVLKSPPRSPKANAICERVIGTIRRECLDWIIQISEAHLRAILKIWVEHYEAYLVRNCIVHHGAKVNSLLGKKPEFEIGSKIVVGKQVLDGYFSAIRAMGDALNAAAASLV